MFKRLVFLWCLFALVLTAGNVGTAGASPAGPVTLGLGTLGDIALSPDGTRLAASTSVGVYFFDPVSLAQVGFWPASETAFGLTWSPDGAALALASYSRLEVREAATGIQRWSRAIWTCWYCQPPDPAFSADGQLVYFSANVRGSDAYDAATGESAGYQTFWDVQQWQSALAPQAASNSPLAANRAVADVDNFSGLRGVMIYDQGAPHSFYEKRWDQVAALSPDGSRLALADDQGRIVVWWVNDRQRAVVEFRAQGGLNPRLAFSRDGRALYVAALNAVTAWSTETGREIAPRLGFTAPVAQVAWTADSQQLIGAQGPHLGAWDVTTQMPVRAGDLAPSQPQGYNLVDLQLSPSGDILATDWGGGFSLYDGGSYAEKYHVFTGRLVRALAFSPDGRLLATGGAGPFVNIWDTATGRPVQDLMTTYTNQGILALAFSRDGRSLHALEHHGLLWTFDLKTGEGTTLRTADPCPGCWYYYDPLIHPLSRRVVVERQHDIAVSDMDTGDLVISALVERPRNIILNNAGSRMAAIVPGGVRIWDVDSGQLLTTLAEPLDYGGDIAFSPDGRQIAVANRHGQVRLWPVP